jgi:hypothetical protein
MDGIPTLNQWVLVEEGMATPSIITIECCGLMVGSTSEEIAEHIKASWALGKCYMLLLFHIIFLIHKLCFFITRSRGC